MHRDLDNIRISRKDFGKVARQFFPNAKWPFSRSLIGDGSEYLSISTHVGGNSLENDPGKSAESYRLQCCSVRNQHRFQCCLLGFNITCF
jgi:hypothetical protein